ncbi:hypothetical protein GCM10010399_65980 [Dactylosporangium fulvum]
MRQQAADLFTAGVSAIEVAAQLEVSTKSAYAWRRAWKAGGSEALQSKGTSGARSKLSDDQMRRLQQRLEAGPAASGYVEDQRWTLPRVVKLIATICHVQYSIKGASLLLLHRMGWTPQMPSHRAVERRRGGDHLVVKTQVASGKGSRAGWARGSASPTRRGKR